MICRSYDLLDIKDFLECTLKLPTFKTSSSERLTELGCWGILNYCEKLCSERPVVADVRSERPVVDDIFDPLLREAARRPPCAHKVPAASTPLVTYGEVKSREARGAQEIPTP